MSWTRRFSTGPYSNGYGQIPLTDPMCILLSERQGKISYLFRSAPARTEDFVAQCFKESDSHGRCSKTPAVPMTNVPTTSIVCIPKEASTPKRLPDYPQRPTSASYNSP